MLLVTVVMLSLSRCQEGLLGALKELGLAAIGNAEEALLGGSGGVEVQREKGCCLVLLFCFPCVRVIARTSSLWNSRVSALRMCGGAERGSCRDVGMLASGPSG